MGGHCLRRELLLLTPALRGKAGSCSSCCSSYNCNWPYGGRGSVYGSSHVLVNAISPAIYPDGRLPGATLSLGRLTPRLQVCPHWASALRAATRHLAR
eukprot:909673-Prymnesium_polylepis.2